MCGIRLFGKTEREINQHVDECLDKGANKVTEEEEEEEEQEKEVNSPQLFFVALSPICFFERKDASLVFIDIAFSLQLLLGRAQQCTKKPEETKPHILVPLHLLSLTAILGESITFYLAIHILTSLPKCAICLAVLQIKMKNYSWMLCLARPTLRGTTIVLLFLTRSSQREV